MRRKRERAARDIRCTGTQRLCEQIISVPGVTARRASNRVHRPELVGVGGILLRLLDGCRRVVRDESPFGGRGRGCGRARCCLCSWDGSSIVAERIEGGYCNIRGLRGEGMGVICVGVVAIVVTCLRYCCCCLV